MVIFLLHCYHFGNVDAVKSHFNNIIALYFYEDPHFVGFNFKRKVPLPAPAA